MKVSKAISRDHDQKPHSAGSELFLNVLKIGYQTNIGIKTRYLNIDFITRCLIIDIVCLASFLFITCKSMLAAYVLVRNPGDLQKEADFPSNLSVLLERCWQREGRLLLVWMKKLAH